MDIRQQKPPQQTSRDVRDEYRRHARGQPEKHRFGEEEPYQPRPADSQRQANGDLSLSPHGASEQQVDDVRAGDEQDDQRNAGQSDSDLHLLGTLSRPSLPYDRTKPRDGQRVAVPSVVGPT